MSPGMEWLWFVVFVFVVGVIGLTVGHKEDE